MENSSMKAFIVLADFEDEVIFVKERSSSGLSQQLKSPPKMRKYEDMSGNLEKSCLKKSALSHLGA